MRKVTTRYVLTINPYQIVRENWVVGKILSLVLSLCFFFKKRAQTAWERPRETNFARPRQVVRSRKKFGWLKMNISSLSRPSSRAGFSFFQNFFFPFLSFFFGGFSPLFFAFFAFFCSPLWPFVDFLIKKNMSNTTPNTRQQRKTSSSSSALRGERERTEKKGSSSSSDDFWRR